MRGDVVSTKSTSTMTDHLRVTSVVKAERSVLVTPAQNIEVVTAEGGPGYWTVLPTEVVFVAPGGTYRVGDPIKVEITTHFDAGHVVTEEGA